MRYKKWQEKEKLTQKLNIESDGKAIPKIKTHGSLCLTSIESQG